MLYGYIIGQFFYLSAPTFLLRVDRASVQKTIFHAPRKVFEKFAAAGAAHIADCAKVWRKWSENERFESQFYHAGEQWDEIALIPLTSGYQGASVVAVHRDESFRGRDKGPAFGGEDIALLWLNFSTMSWRRI